MIPEKESLEPKINFIIDNGQISPRYLATTHFLQSGNFE